MKAKQLYHGGILAALLCIAAILSSQVFLRNLYVVLAFDETFSAIFRQISHARIWPPVILSAVLSFCASLWTISLWSRGRRRILAVLWSILTLLVLVAGNILLSRVNEIRFCDVLISLLDVMRKGGL